MKAGIYNGIKDVKVKEIKKPTINAKDAIIKVVIDYKLNYKFC